MNKKLLIVFAGFFLVTALSGLFAWAFYTPPKPDHRAVVIDTSISAATDRCTEAGKVAEMELKRPPVNDKTKLFPFFTGDKRTANEPYSFDPLDIPMRVKLTESNSAITSQQNGAVNNLKQQCEKIPESSSSSIFLAVKRAVETLRNAGCDDKSKCEVLVQSDIQENADAQIKAAISGNAIDPKNLPSPIDNQGIAIRFCGVSETKGEIEATDKKGQKNKKTRFTQNRNSNRVDLIQATWRNLFLSKDLVSFSSSCSE